MGLYNIIKDFAKGTIVTGGLLVMLAGCSKQTPIYWQNEDVTGDNIPDPIVDITCGPQREVWLFISQKDGSFVRARQYKNEDVSYFKTDDGTAYFFDGEFYKLSPKQKPKQ